MFYMVDLKSIDVALTEIARRIDANLDRRRSIYAALDLLKHLQTELWKGGEFEGWRIITKVYEHVARQL